MPATSPAAARGSSWDIRSLGALACALRKTAARRCGARGGARRALQLAELRPRLRDRLGAAVGVPRARTRFGLELRGAAACEVVGTRRWRHRTRGGRRLRLRGDGAEAAAARRRSGEWLEAGRRDVLRQRAVDERLACARGGPA